MGKSLIALAFVIAGVAYRWVEHPLRRFAASRFSPSRLLGLAAASCFGLAGLAIALSHFDPVYSSARGDILRRLILADNDAPRMIRGGCESTTDAESGVCVYGKPGGERKVALFGDSHAQHLFDGLDAAAMSAGWELRIWARGGCTPIDYPTSDPICTTLYRQTFRDLAAYQPDLIIISSSNGGAFNLHDPRTGKKHARQTSMEIWSTGFHDTLTRLSRLSPRVVVVRDTPLAAKQFGVACLETQPQADCATPRSEALSAESPDVAVARAIPGIALLDLTDRFCDRKKCRSVDDGTIVYRADNNHLTATMSLRLAPGFVTILEDRH